MPAIAGVLAGVMIVLGIRAAETVPVNLHPASPEVSIALAPMAIRAPPVPRRRPEPAETAADALASAKPPAQPEPAPRIALIIDDMGIDVERSARVVGLDATLTLAYLPYASSVRAQAEIARAAGHELLVHVPMEPTATDKHAGPNALETGLAPSENVRRLRWALERFDGFVGINNHMGSRFTTDARSLGPILHELKRRDLLFVDSLTASGSAGRTIARAIGLRFAERDVFLDHIDDPREIRGSLALLERVALTTGTALGIGHPRDATIAELEAWIPSARRRGFVLVPVSRIVREDPLITAPRLPVPVDGPA